MFKKITKELIIWGVWIVIGFVLAALINSFVLVNAQVLTGSMEGTILTHDRVFGLRTSYIFGEPRRGDIIVFESPLPNEFEEPFIKRIIGLPGEEIAILGGVVHIDGVPLAETYVEEEMRRDFEPIIVPNEAFFVMGDNRNYSRDSREWGPVAAETIIGRIYLGFSPMPTIIANYNYILGGYYEAKPFSNN